MVVPLCSGIIYFVKGVCITFIGAYILAISPSRTRNLVEAIFFGLFGLGLLVLNFGFITQMFIWVRNVFVREQGEGGSGTGSGTKTVDGQGIGTEGDEAARFRTQTETSDGHGAGGEMAIDLPEGGSEVEGGQEGVARYFCREHGASFVTFGDLHHTRSAHGHFSCCLDYQVLFPQGENGASRFLIEHLIGIYPDPRGSENDSETLKVEDKKSQIRWNMTMDNILLDMLVYETRAGKKGKT